MQGVAYRSSTGEPRVPFQYGGSSGYSNHQWWSDSSTTEQVPKARSSRKYPSASGQLCLNFTRTGFCRYGDQCYHYHDRDLVAFCKGWLAHGTCSRGGKCTLNHPDLAGPKDPRRTPECGMFLRHGKCPMADKCQYLHVHKKVDTPVCESFEKNGFCEEGEKCKKLHYIAPIRQQLKRDSPEGSLANEKKDEAPLKKKKKTLSKEEIERQLDEEGMRAWEAGGLMKVIIYFNGKAIWVVGASSGLGRAIARILLHAAKPRVLIVSARREGRLKELKDLAADVNPGVDVHIVPVDLARSTDKQLADISAKVESFCGDEGVDVLFNCAGVGYRGTALDTPMEVLREHMQVNFFGQVAIAKGLLPEWFKSAGSRKYIPHLIQVSSVQGKFGQGGRSAYAAAKHAQLGYFDSLRAELEAAGAGRVTMCLPGYINSEHSENAMLNDGTKCGVHDQNAAGGSSPEYVAKDILCKAALGRREVVTSQASGKLGIIARTLVPEMFLEQMARRYRKKGGYPSPPSNGRLTPILCITALVAATLWFLFL